MQRRLRKKYVKKFRSYILPLFISLILAGGTLYGVNMLVSSDISKQTSVHKNVVGSFTTPDEDVVMVVDNKENQLPMNYAADIRNGEGLTAGNKPLSLKLSDNSTLIMDARSKVFFEMGDHAMLDVMHGNIWAQKNPDTKDKNLDFVLNFANVTLTKGTLGVMDSGKVETLFVIGGEATLRTKNEHGDVIATMTLGSGQAVTLSKSVLTELQKDPMKKLVMNTPDSVLASSWYVQNRGNVKSMTETMHASSENGSFMDLIPGTKVQGNEVSGNDEKNEGGENAAESSGPDNVAPDAPILTYPSNNKITKSYDKLFGTVGADVEKVEVNGYVLKKYVPGSGEWNYFLSADQGNMIIGKNSFTVYAYDKAGNKSEPLSVSVVYMP